MTYTYSQLLEAFVMEFNRDNKVFVNLTKNAEAERKKTKTNSAVWFLIVGLAEVIGTGMLVFIGCSGIVPSITSTAPSHFQISINFGMAVTIIIVIFGHISGAHINPAVTLAALIYKLISLPAAGLYILAHFIGAILGYGVLLVMVPTEALYIDKSNMNVTHGFCTTVPNANVTSLQAFLAEFTATAILIYVCCSVWDKRNANKQESIPAKFGITIAALAMALGPFSGASMNPARTFAPAVFTGVWDRQWIYWLGPLSASLTTAFFYKFVFDRNHNLQEIDQSDVPLNQVNSKVQNIEKISTEDIATL